MKEFIIQVNESDLAPSEKACIKEYHPVELVRCKDCGYWYRQTCRYHVVVMPQEDEYGFCEKAIRKK